MQVQRIVLLAGAVLVLVVSVRHFVLATHDSQAHGVVDFPIFLGQAREFLETGVLYPEPDNPERYEPAAAVYKYPPFYAMLLLPLVRDGIDPAVILHHWMLQIVLYGLALGLLLKAFSAPRPWAFAGIAAILALNFEPFFETLWRLQAETPILLLLALCLVCIQRGRDRVAGMTVGLAGMLKVYPAFLLLYFVVKRRWAALGWCVATAVLVGVATLVVIGPEQNRAYFLDVLPLLLAEPAATHPENMGLARYVGELGADPVRAKRLAQIVTVPALIVTLVVLYRRERRGDSRNVEALEFGCVLAGMLVAMPNSWANYQLLLLIPILALVARGLTTPDGRTVAFTAAGAAFALTLFYKPCELIPGVSTHWPCAQTPFFLGLHRMPRGVHDLFVSLRVLANVMTWAACLFLLVSAGRRREDDRTV